VVYNSVGGAERHTGIPHFESKRRVEEHIESLGLAATFVRPTFFMENFVHFFAPKVEDGTLVFRLPLPAGVPLHMIATADIGTVSAAALLAPDRIVGASIKIAGDELTGEQITTVHGDRAGLPSRYEPIPLATLSGSPDQLAMFTWFASPVPYQGDCAATRSLAPDVQNLAAWLPATDLPATAPLPALTFERFGGSTCLSRPQNWTTSAANGSVESRSSSTTSPPSSRGVSVASRSVDTPRARAAKPNTHNLGWAEDADCVAQGQGWLWPGSVYGAFDVPLGVLAFHDARVGSWSAPR